MLREKFQLSFFVWCINFIIYIWLITIVTIRVLGVYILPVFMMGQKGEIAVMFFHFYSGCVPYSDHFSQLKGLINNCIRTWFRQNFLSLERRCNRIIACPFFFVSAEFISRLSCQVLLLVYFSLKERSNNTINEPAWGEWGSPWFCIGIGVLSNHWHTKGHMPGNSCLRMHMQCL